MEMWRAYNAGDLVDLAAEAKGLKEKATYHLRNRVLTDRDNQRTLDEIGRHNDNDNLLRFLIA